MININGQVVNAKDKVTITRKFAEDHDTGKLKVISSKTTKYEVYSTVDYTDGDIDEQMLIESDSVIQLNATDYEHTITLLENKSKFDGIFPADRSFTKTNQTLLNILNVYKRELLEYHNILIDWDLTATQLSEIIPFKEFAGINFTTILVSVFRKLDAIPYVDRVDETWLIKARPYNERGVLISGDSITKSFTQTNLDYATKVKAQLKNAINERAQVDVEWFPSENGYILPKSPNPIKVESDLQYKLPSPIVAMLEVIAVDVDYIYEPAESTESNPITISVTQDIDITNQVVTKEVYDSLLNITSVSTQTIDQSDNKKNHIYYSLFGNTIENLFESSTDRRFYVNFNTYYLLNAIRRIIAQSLPAGYKTFTLGTQEGGTTDTEDVKLRFKYVKQRNIDMVSHRKTKGDMIATTTMHNQRDSNVEISQYKKALKNYSNRLGNDEYSKSKNVPVGQRPHEIGDFIDDGKVVVQVTNTYHANFTYCEWIEVENFANLEAEYAISKSPSPYTISNKTVQTNIVSEEYVWFSEQQIGIDTRLTDFSQRGLLGLFESDFVPNFEKVHSAVFKPVLPTWDDTKAISMELANDGDGNLITFHSYFEHQLIAGYMYYDLDTDTFGDLQPLKYTDDNGELDDFQIYFARDVLFNDNGEYPLIIDEVDYINNKMSLNDINEPLDLDINASFAFTYNISFIADKDIFVGEFLARNNYLISDQQDTHNIEIYKSIKPYTLYDQVPRASDVLANMTYTYDFTNRKITFFASEDVEHFTITKNGNILLALNKTLTSGQQYTVNINILKKISDVTRVGQVEGTLDLSGSLTVFGQEFFSPDTVGTMTLSGTVEVRTQENFNDDVTGSLQLSGALDVVKEETDQFSVSVSGSMALTGLTTITEQENFIVDTIGSMALSGTQTVVVDEFDVFSDDVVGSIILSGTLTVVKDEDLTLESDVVGTMNMAGTVSVVQDEFEIANTDVVGTMTMTATVGVIKDEFEVASDDVVGTINIGGTTTGELLYRDWVYIGDSGITEDETVTLSAKEGSCRTTSQVRTALLSLKNPSNFTDGYIIKVNHTVAIETSPGTFDTFDCTTYYYEKETVTQ